MMQRQTTTALALLIALVATTALVTRAYAYEENYVHGWYTLFQRVHCAPGEDRDGGCFCNNPNACEVQFTNDRQTNEWILLDIIKSQGNGHFIPDNLRENFDDIVNSINTVNFDHPFSQCLSLEENAGIHLHCLQTLRTNINDNDPDNDNTNNDLGQTTITDNHDTDNDNY